MLRELVFGGRGLFRFIRIVPAGAPRVESGERNSKAELTLDQEFLKETILAVLISWAILLVFYPGEGTG